MSRLQISAHGAATGLLKTNSRGEVCPEDEDEGEAEEEGKKEEEEKREEENLTTCKKIK